MRLQCTAQRQKEKAGRHRSVTHLLHPGDRIWLPTRNLPLHLPCKKLSPWFLGPFKVLRRVNEVTHRLQLPSDYCISPFHGSLLRPVVPGPLADAGLHPSASPWTLGGPAYAVRSLLDKPTLWVSVPVPGGLGGVRSKGAVLGSGGGHSGSQHHP